MSTSTVGMVFSNSPNEHCQAHIREARSSRFSICHLKATMVVAASTATEKTRRSQMDSNESNTVQYNSRSDRNHSPISRTHQRR